MQCHLSAHFHGEADEDALFLFLRLLYPPESHAKRSIRRSPQMVTSADDASNLGRGIVSAPPFLFTLEHIELHFASPGRK